VRVPAVVVSPLIEPGTVFRSPSGTPYDHTSILATLRDWLAIPPTAMLPSRRIAAAPTLDQLLTRAAPRPDQPAMGQVRAAPVMTLADQARQPLNHLQQSMVVAAEARDKQRPLTDTEVQQLLQKVRTRGAARDHLKLRGLARK
jgi:phospholipase C